MLETKDLVFFDKNGTGYAFDYDKDKNLWTGAIYIDPVSKGLFETEKICVTQKYVVMREATDQNMSDAVCYYEYGYPSTSYGLIGSDSQDYYEFVWDDEIHEVDELNMFSFDKSFCMPEDTSVLTYSEYNCPTLNFIDYVRIENLTVNPISTQADPVYDEDTSLWCEKFEKTAGWKPGFIDVNLCFCNVDDEYETFRRDLQLYYVDPFGTRTLVGLFNIYAKSIEEDERLTTMCNNLGYAINNIDFSIFQDSDIKEQVLDYNLLNLKRKEILMEGHNIYPFIGSYKSLINAIRFFGYDNVTIKEWWENVDLTSSNCGKHFTTSSYSLKEHEVIHDGSIVTLPSKKYRKTGKLNLAYNINTLKKDTDGNIKTAESSYYGHEYPETDEQFTYSIEEAVIKLFGLKRKLEKEFLPLATRIIDVVGEADAFFVPTIKHTTSENFSFLSNNHIRNDFSVLGSEDNFFYLEDLRPFGIHSTQLPHGNGMVGNLRHGNADYIGDYKAAYDAIMDMGSDFHEFGTTELHDYNGSWSPYNISNSPITGSDDITGYAKNWDLEQISNIKITGTLSDIQELEGTGSCLTGSDYSGPVGIVSPYEMNGNLFGVFGDSLANCEPWIYYTQMHSDGPGNYYLAEFSNYYPNLKEVFRSANDFESDENTHLPDNENIPIGALVELRLDEIDVTWNDVLYTYDELIPVTWNHLNLFVNNISRVEWNIHKDEDLNPGFDTTIFGEVKYGYADIGIVLPYVGDYDVRLCIYDWNNNMNVINKEKIITVYPKEVEFTGWCKMNTNKLNWQSDTNWDTLSTEWNFPYVNDITWNDIKSVSFNGLDRGFFSGEYVDTEDVDERMMVYNFEDGINGDEFYTIENNRGSYFWNNLDVAWQDMDHLYWDAMNIGGDIPCYFSFGYFDISGNATNSSEDANDSLPGKWIEIVDEHNRYGSFKFPESSSSSLNYVADIVRQLNESSDPVISNFYYSYIWQSKVQQPDLNIPDGFNIVAVSKNHGRNGNVKHVGIVDTARHAYVDSNNVLHIQKDVDNHQLRFFTKMKEYNPTWNDLVCINNVTRIPKYTDVNFNYTNCRILGKKNPVWKFTNLNTGSCFISNKKNYHRLFKETGCWEVQLTLNDTNNNVYTAKRNLLITV